MTDQRLARRKKRREKNFAELKAENIRLKKIIALDRRKAEHGCTDANCPHCKEEHGDGDWEFEN